MLYPPTTTTTAPTIPPPHTLCEMNGGDKGSEDQEYSIQKLGTATDISCGKAWNDKFAGTLALNNRVAMGVVSHERWF